MAKKKAEKKTLTPSDFEFIHPKPGKAAAATSPVKKTHKARPRK